MLDENRRPESQTLRLRSEAVSVLLDLLSQAPQPAQALLELLLREDDGPGPGGWPLQKALVDLIRKALRALQDAAPGSPGGVEAIYGALRTLRCPAELLGAELRLLCEELLEACRTEGSPLQEERLLSCLLHKAGRGLLSLYGHAYAEKAAVKPLKASSSGEGVFPLLLSCVLEIPLCPASLAFPSPGPFMLLRESSRRGYAKKGEAFS